MPCKERMIKVLRTENYGIGYYNYSCDNGEFSTAVISKNYKTLPYQLCNKISKEFGIYNMNRTDIISIVVKILKEYYDLYKDEIECNWLDFLEVGILIVKHYENQKVNNIVSVLIGEMIYMEQIDENATPTIIRGSAGVKFANNHLMIINQRKVMIHVMPNRYYQTLCRNKVYNSNEELIGSIIVSQKE